MLVVGLTGGIGAGKSTVSAALARRGAAVIDADAITRELQAPGQPVFEAMVERFGADILDAAGELDRARVASIVFADPEALAALNEIVHPAVGEEIARRLGELADRDGVVVLDVPLLVETGRGDLAAVIVVDVDPDLAVRRLVEHRGFAEGDARARIAQQAPREQRLARADFVIDNAGDRAHLEEEVDRCWRWLQELGAGQVDATGGDASGRGAPGAGSAG